LVRRRQCHLDVARRILLEKVDFVFREALLLPDALDNDSSQAIVSVPPVPGSRDRAIHIEAVNRIIEIGHETTASQLAVREDFESEVLLTA
jgi:hypothetical protein